MVLLKIYLLLLCNLPKTLLEDRQKKAPKRGLF